MTSPVANRRVDLRIDGHAEIVTVDYEPWQAETLTQALCQDAGYRFWFGDRFTTENVRRFFGFYLDGLVKGGGSLVTLRGRTGVPYRGAIFGWRRFGAPFPPNQFDGMMDALGAAGQRRYLWFREQSQIPLSTFGIAAADEHMTVRLNIGGLRPGHQNQGVGTRISMLSLARYEAAGFQAPYVVSSSVAGQRYIARCGYTAVEGGTIFESSYYGDPEPRGLLSIISFRDKGARP